MATFSLPLNQMTGAVLEGLVANGVCEDRQLDYKRDLPGKTR